MAPYAPFAAKTGILGSYASLLPSDVFIGSYAFFGGKTDFLLAYLRLFAKHFFFFFAAAAQMRLTFSRRCFW